MLPAAQPRRSRNESLAQLTFLDTFVSRGRHGADQQLQPHVETCSKVLALTYSILAQLTVSSQPDMSGPVELMRWVGIEVDAPN